LWPVHMIVADIAKLPELLGTRYGNKAKPLVSCANGFAVSMPSADLNAPRFQLPCARRLEQVPCEPI
jgi:hypothetical protein